MTFLSLSFLIAGLAAAVVPIALHLLMRGRPKKVVFPAFTFLRRRAEATRRKLTLKRILLLCLRCTILIGIGLALARPSLKSPDAAPSGVEHRDGPVAAAFVVDTSVRMGVIAENKTRLDRARQIASRLIASLPEGSKAAIFDSKADSDSFQVDLLAAEESLERLRPGASVRPLAGSAAAAVRLLGEADATNRELYILTDFTSASWPESFRGELRRVLDEDRRKAGDESPIAFYLIDVSTPLAQNGGITSCAIAMSGGEKGALRVDLDVSHFGPAQDGTIEFWLLDPAAENRPSDGETSAEPPRASADSDTLAPEIFERAKKIASSPIAFEASETATRRQVTLYPPTPPDGFSLGFVRLVPDDAFSADNVRWFAIRRGRAPNILLAASEPLEEKTLFIREALSPEELRRDGTAPFDAKTVSLETLDRMTPEELAGYRAILLLDPGALNGPLYKRLADYVSAGGGLGLFYGKGGVPAPDDSDALVLLGGRLTETVRRAGKGVVFVPSDAEHPILAEFRPLLGVGAVPWNDLVISRYWKYEPTDETSETVLRYSDGGAAVVSRPLREGTVVLATTPFSESANRPGAWNRLTVGEGAWVFLMLADGIARSLVLGGGESLQLEPGSTAVLRPNLEPFPAAATLELPDGERVSIPTEQDRRRIRFAGTRRIGPYRLAFDSDGAPNSPSVEGFCVNAPAGDFELSTLNADALKKYWEPTPLQSVSDASDVVSGRFSRRIGRELFSLIVVLLGVLLAVEAAFSNRFYD